MALDWAPVASHTMLRLRAEVLIQIRQFFQDRQILEVDTPVLSVFGTTDPNVESFKTRYHGPGECNGRMFYLRTSPEFHMKRLLAAGCGAIYQIGKVFRQSESGELHNPEFTLLEWYRPGFDRSALMAEVEQLVDTLFRGRLVLQRTEILSYRQAFDRSLGLDPFNATIEALASCARYHRIQVIGLDANDRDAWLNLLMSHCVQPALGTDRMCFVTDYPASQAALAKIKSTSPPVADRFELFINGIEIANGFNELLAAQEQNIRFEREQLQRRRQQKQTIPMDAYLIDALKHGLPPCSGVALGIDRLIMLMCSEIKLDQTFAFPLDRA